MKPVLSQGLSAMGLKRHFPQVAAHGLLAYQVLNLPNLYMEQVITHVQTLVKYGSHVDDSTGMLLHTN